MTVGTDRHVQDRVGVAVHDRDDPRVAGSHKRCNSTASRLHARTGPVGLQRQYQRDLRPAIDHRQRRPCERKRRRLCRLLPRVAALTEGPHRKHRDDRRQCRQSARESSQAACCALGGFSFAAFGCLAGGEEVALEPGEVVGVVGCPFVGGGESRAAVQRRRVAGEGVPFAGGLVETAVDEQPGAVSVDPAA
jgi:hypothetical protein